jgi:hypothetical protein
VRRRVLAGAAAVMAAALGAAVIAVPAAAETDEVRVHNGEINGARFRVEVPARWNGTLLLYSHGLYSPGFIPEEIELVNQKPAKQRLLDDGYALAASLYRTPNGYPVQPALDDEERLLNWFDTHVGRPDQVVSWGASGGGLISVLLGERNPHRIDGVLSMCGPVGGGPGLMNQFLDLAFVIRTLLAPDRGLELVHITQPAENEATADAVVQGALATAQGRARLALAAALASVPGWSRALEPRPTTVTDQVAQAATYNLVFGWFAWGAGRADIETQAGGNPSWNVGVDYRRQLARSSGRDLVERAYREAGLDLGADLARLDAAPRVRPDRPAAEWLARFGQPMGRTVAPVLTLHAVGDGVPVEHEREYAEQVARFGGPDRLRQLFVNRGGHCMHTAAEELTALAVLERRIRTGRWPATDPIELNRDAGSFDAALHVLYDWTVDRAGASPPAFVAYSPGPFLRPFRQGTIGK